MTYYGYRHQMAADLVNDQLQDLQALIKGTLQHMEDHGLDRTADYAKFESISLDISRITWTMIEIGGDNVE